MLVVKRAGRRCNRQARNNLIGNRIGKRDRAARVNHGVDGAVIDFIQSRQASNRQHGLRNVSAQPRRLRHVVVASLRATDAVATDCHRFARADIAVGKSGRDTRRIKCDRVSTKYARQSGCTGQCRIGVAVIGLVIGRDATHRQLDRTDNSGQPSRLLQVIVQRIDAREGVARHRDILGNGIA